MIAYISDPK
jgi:hypothetical protein